MRHGNIEFIFSCTVNSQWCFYNNTQSKSDWQYCSVLHADWLTLENNEKACGGELAQFSSWWDILQNKPQKDRIFMIIIHKKHYSNFKIIVFCPCSKLMAKYWNRWHMKFVSVEIECRCCAILSKIEATSLWGKLFEDGYSFLSTKSRPESPSDRL